MIFAKNSNKWNAKDKRLSYTIDTLTVRSHYPVFRGRPPESIQLLCLDKKGEKSQDYKERARQPETLAFDMLC